MRSLMLSFKFAIFALGGRETVNARPMVGCILTAMDFALPFSLRHACVAISLRQ